MRRVASIVFVAAVLGLVIFWDGCGIIFRVVTWRGNIEGDLTLRTSRGETPFLVNPLFQEQYDIIDNFDKQERCKKYGFGYNVSQTPRRIFFGAMVADESYDVVRIHAAETYGLYHVVAIVESNETHMNTPRALRFGPGTEGHDLIHSGIFGPNTSVYVDVFTGDYFGALDLDREEIQREEILRRWKKAGMRADDVGLMADFDETMSRDFLHVGITCDIPEVRSGQNCQAPRIWADTLVFEGSPECISETWWFHPDFVIGECIKHVGNPRGRPIPVRYYLGLHGERADGWGRNHTDDYPDEVMKNGSFPLANGADMRTGVFNYAPYDVAYFPAGYHFHNFFDVVSELRHKYMTYAHGNTDVAHLALSDLQADVDLMVRCVHDLPNSANPSGIGRFEAGFDAYSESKPIFFLSEEYRRKRHGDLKRMVEDDEKQFGSKYTDR